MAMTRVISVATMMANVESHDENLSVCKSFNCRLLQLTSLGDQFTDAVVERWSSL